MKSLQTYVKESIDSDYLPLPIEFDIYNEGPKNQNFKLTKFHLRKAFDKINYSEYGDMVLLPFSASDLYYEKTPDKDSTNDFTQIPEICKYAKIQTWFSDKWVESYNWKEWNKIMDNWLKGLKPYIKHGKLHSKIEEYNDHKYIKMILNVDDVAFNKDREAKIAEMEDLKNLETWKANWEMEEEKKKQKAIEAEIERKKEEAAKKEYEEWENNLSDEDKKSRSMGYGPHHPYEISHPWAAKGYHTSRGWFTGD